MKTSAPNGGGAFTIRDSHSGENVKMTSRFSRYAPRVVMLAVALIFLAAMLAFAAGAQNQAHTVIERRLNFRPGRTGAAVSGTARYGMSYVYRVRAREGQTTVVRLTSPAKRALFSVIAPDGETIEGAFTTAQWSGELPQTGEYRIVVVMEDQVANKVPYKLSVSIR